VAEASRTDWARVRATRDEDIDASEGALASLDAESLATMRVLMPVSGTKRLLSLRIDDDVVKWFKATGRGYQSRMNAVLRAYMLAGRAKDSRRHPGRARP
jgi:uncharacterized protein (DUF4415 family)